MNKRIKNRLRDKISGIIDDAPDRMISFHDFMELCLYDPDFGYYTSQRKKVGKDGDFYTSPAIGGLLGLMLANYFGLRVPDGEPLSIIEWGGGTGTLAKGILDAMAATMPSLYERTAYTIVERSSYHRTLQTEALAAHVRAAAVGPDDPQAAPGDRFAIVFSNELLDSFSVHRVRMKGGRLYELFVRNDPVGGWFEEVERLCVNDAVSDYLADGSIRLQDGQTADINLAAPAWIAQRIGELERGILLSIDYGDVAEEIFASHRMNGTLLCYKRHLAFDSPYMDTGEQDITAHVDFSACIRSGQKAGADEWKLLTQSQFLEEAGILSLLGDHEGTDPFSPQAKRNRAIRQLLLSDMMGELFKVLIQEKK